MNVNGNANTLRLINRLQAADDVEIKREYVETIRTNTNVVEKSFYNRFMSHKINLGCGYQPAKSSLTSGFVVRNECDVSVALSEKHNTSNFELFVIFPPSGV